MTQNCFYAFIRFILKYQDFSLCSCNMFPLTHICCSDLKSMSRKGIKFHFNKWVDKIKHIQNYFHRVCFQTTAQGDYSCRKNRLWATEKTSFTLNEEYRFSNGTIPTKCTFNSSHFLTLWFFEGVLLTSLCVELKTQHIKETYSSQKGPLTQELTCSSIF